MTQLGKKILRNQLKLRRLEISDKHTQDLNNRIVQHCLDLIPFDEIRSLHTYVPILSDNEIVSWQLLDYVWQIYPHVQTSVPKLNSFGKYDSVVVSPKTDWQTAEVRIPEPTNGEILATNSRFDVIVVPMLGFDDYGHRLGHGLGWYDRFLATQPRALTIGLSYEFGFVRSGLPHETHDVALKYIVTEKSVRKF